MTSLIFDHILKDSVSDRLAGFRVEKKHDELLKPAAVAIVLVASDRDPVMEGLAWSDQNPQEVAIVLTRRSARLNKHAGQWALPGGRMDEGETAVVAALRELDEEVGLALDSSSVLGVLDSYPTRSGFSILPVVIWGGKQPRLEPNPDEVASIHRLPARELLRDDAPLLDPIPESQHPVLRMPIGSAWIAAPTAAMLYQFREVVMLGNPTRVAHYEEPYFAWK